MNIVGNRVSNISLLQGYIADIRWIARRVQQDSAFRSRKADAEATPYDKPRVVQEWRPGKANLRGEVVFAGMV
jgi:hypothetical protein